VYYLKTPSCTGLFPRVNAEEDALFAAEESLLAMELPLIPSEEEKARKAASKLKSMDPKDPSYALDHPTAKVKKGQGVLLADMMSDDEGDEGDVRGRGKGNAKASKDITKDHRVISALLDQEVEVSPFTLLDPSLHTLNPFPFIALSAHRFFYTTLTQATHKKRS
jgi:hypothetical protein